MLYSVTAVETYFYMQAALVSNKVEVQARSCEYQESRKSFRLKTTSVQFSPTVQIELKGSSIGFRGYLY